MTTAARRWLGALLFLALLPLALQSVLLLAVHGQRFGNPYHLADLAMNYVQFGAIRRGLAGTLVHLSGLGLGDGAVALHVAAAVGVLAGACWMLTRRPASAPVLAAFAVVLAGLLQFWAVDLGRGDILVALLLVLATLAARAGRWGAAGLAVTVSLFAHETGFIFGAPLLLALLLRDGWRAIDRRGAVRAGAVLLAGLLLYLALGALPHQPAAAIAATVQAELPRTERVDQALYFALAGGRGLRTALCQNALDPNYWLHGASGLALILLATFALVGTGRRSWGLALLASVPPFVLLWIVANDMSRWITFALLGLWMVAALLPASTRPTLAWPRLASAVLVLLLQSPGLVWVDYPILVTSPLIDNIAHKLGAAATPSVESALARCDPAWREVLGTKPP